MRVTKVIREYVEREIRNKFKEKIEDAMRDYREKQKELDRRLDKLCTETEEKAYEIAKSMGFDYCYDGQKVTHINSGFDNEELREAAYASANALRERERKAIEDIILNLELGETTKSELKGAIDAVEVDE